MMRVPVMSNEIARMRFPFKTRGLTGPMLLLLLLLLLEGPDAAAAMQGMDLIFLTARVLLLGSRPNLRLATAVNNDVRITARNNNYTG